MHAVVKLACSLCLLLQGCNSVLFFEARKRKDLYVWLARAPDGPSIKFHCANGGSPEHMCSTSLHSLLKYIPMQPVKVHPYAACASGGSAPSYNC